MFSGAAPTLTSGARGSMIRTRTVVVRLRRPRGSTACTRIVCRPTASVTLRRRRHACSLALSIAQRNRIRLAGTPRSRERNEYVTRCLSEERGPVTTGGDGPAAGRARRRGVRRTAARMAEFYLVPWDCQPLPAGAPRAGLAPGEQAQDILGPDDRRTGVLQPVQQRK